jgi:hypothetical protein
MAAASAASACSSTASMSASGGTEAGAGSCDALPTFSAAAAKIGEHDLESSVSHECSRRCSTRALWSLDARRAWYPRSCGDECGGCVRCVVATRLGTCACEDLQCPPKRAANAVRRNPWDALDGMVLAAVVRRMGCAR